MAVIYLNKVHAQSIARISRSLSKQRLEIVLITSIRWDVYVNVEYTVTLLSKYICSSSQKSCDHQIAEVNSNISWMDKLVEN